MNWKNGLAVSLLLTSAGVPALYGQGIITGSVSGTIQDPTGAVVPGAKVMALNPKTGAHFDVTSTSSGEFSFSNLPVGEYILTVKTTGFEDLKLEHVLVETGKVTGLGVEKLQTGTAVETVEVTTGQNLLETTQSQVTTTFDSEAIENLPTGGGLDQLALLIPGVAATHSANFSNTNGVGLSSNGQRGRSNNFELDGQANNDNSVAGEQVFFQNQDALAEIQIITNDFSAQYGRNMGSVVNYITKSGTNSIHGSAFEYYTGDFLSSLTQGDKSQNPLTFNRCAPGIQPGTVAGNTCASPTQLPRFTDNTFGATLGFPILKDKLFGFASTQFSRNLGGLSFITTAGRLAATPAALALLQQDFPNNPGVAELTNFGPQAATGPKVNYGTIVYEPIAGVTNGTTTATTPNGSGVPFAQVTRPYNPTSYDQEDLGRLDFQATPKDRFFLRYFYQNAPDFPDGSATNGAFYNVTDIAHSVGSDWTHTFGPRWVNQLRYSFQQTTLAFDGGGFPNCTIKNLSSCPSTVTLSSPFLSLGEATNIPQGRVVKVNQVQDNVTWNLGRHSITFGGEFDYQNSPNVFLPYINGALAFTSINNLLADNASSLTLATGASPNIHFTEPDEAAYFQDDWKVSASLTLNLGIRYELFGQSLNLLHNTTVASQTGPNPQWQTSLPLSVTTFPYIPTFKKGFEPRVGFAFNPEQMKKLVIRGGFAINFDPAYYNIALNSYSAAPVVNQSTFTGCNGTTVMCLPAAGAYNSAVHAQDDVLNPKGGNPGAKTETQVTPNFHNPYAESFTLGVQYEVLKQATLEVRYSGNHTVGNFQSINANPTVGPALNPVVIAGNNYSGVGQLNFGGGAIALVPALSTNFPQYAGAYCTTGSLNSGITATVSDVGREHCGSTLVRLRANTAWSIYNSLQTQLTTRNLYGFTGQVAWTWGKQEDNSSEVFSTNSGGNTNAFAQNPFNIDQGERSIGGTDYKNVTSAGLTYTLPIYKNSHNFVGKVVGGLQFNVLYSFNSGQPFTPSQYYYSTLGSTYASAATKANPVAFGNTVLSSCDYNFNVGFTSYDVCRPFIGNPSAPRGTVGVNLGNGQYVDANGHAIQRNQARYIVNNVNEELVQGTPYGNVQRNTAFGNSYNNVNLGVFKSFHVTERYNVQLQATAFNALNRGYYGTPDVLMDDAALGNGGTFNNFSGNTGSSFGPSENAATGARNIQIGAKVQF